MSFSAVKLRKTKTRTEMKENYNIKPERQAFFLGLHFPLCLFFFSREPNRKLREEKRLPECRKRGSILACRCDWWAPGSEPGRDWIGASPSGLTCLSAKKIKWVLNREKKERQGF